MGARQALGRYGEDVAVRTLLEAGMEVLDRNWRCAQGELDVVARDGATLVVCEVKTRSGTGWGTPAEAVTPVKLARLRRLAGAWLAEHDDVRPERVRVDVVGVLRSRTGPAVVDHRVGVV